MKNCPCGSSLTYDKCCEPYIIGLAFPPTALALMRSRYSAYVEKAIDYIVDTCLFKDGKRDIDIKQTKDWSEKSNWLGLKIISTNKGEENDSEGVVEFEALYEYEGFKDVHHETAFFKKVDGKWLYDKGEIVPKTIVRSSPKVGRNEPCPCGSGKKYKHCCSR